MDVAVSLVNASRPPKARPSTSYHRRLACSLLVALASVAIVSFPRAVDAGFVGRPAGDFGPGDPSPLVMPTAAAVDGEGNVFVADGVNDRVVQFDANGQRVTEIRSIGEEKLARPVGVKVDAAGRLWIVDTGHGRVLVRKPDGTLEHIFGPKPAPGVQLLDVTDVMPVGDGSACWLVDNDGHRLARSVGQESEPLTIGGRGEGLGRFQYPFAIAQGINGDLFVTDVINGRVQALNKSGQPLFAVASYGVGIGQVYRPKGVACDAKGNVWVSDGTLGVVQTFSAAGKVIDVLRDEKGEPFRFDVPMGLTFDRQGRLYVVELRPGRVRRLEITEKPSAGKPFTSVRPQVTPQQPRACAACHLEWMEPFASGGSSPLMARPVGKPEEPLAARPEMCLSCHDGSVADSRRRVWLDHGHRVGMQPPASITVPASLPLVGGKLACRTCHSAHGPGGMQSADINRTVFLRMPNPAR